MYQCIRSRHQQLCRHTCLATAKLLCHSPPPTHIVLRLFLHPFSHTHTYGVNPSFDSSPHYGALTILLKITPGNGQAFTLITENTRRSILDGGRWVDLYLDVGAGRIGTTETTTHAIHNMRTYLIGLHRNMIHVGQSNSGRQLAGVLAKRRKCKHNFH